MPTIRQLDPHVADLIAAGEVVERPASVVKELMENAIDAGANAVTVEIAHGGMSLIRVTDDGCGIAPDQCRTAFLRHATSKISSEYDLEAIGTLGFRGEALAAIAAVSRVELLTNQGQGLGTALTLEGGQVMEQEEAGCPKGTTMLVRDLFYNTPARLKFMKRDSAEGAAVFAVVQHLALSHPELSVKFIRDGKQELLTPGDGQLKSAIYAVLGRDLALGFVPVKGSGENMEISGFVSLPTCCRGSRSYQHFFVNGRYIKSRVMMAALEEAYRNQKMVGKFPGCVLHLTLRPNSVDVNVHPTKTEVKFQNEQQVFATVYHGVLAALNADKTRPQAVVKSVLPRQDTVTPNQTSLRDFTAVTASHGTVTTPPAAVVSRPQTTPSPFRRVTPLDQVAPSAPVAEKPLLVQPERAKSVAQEKAQPVVAEKAVPVATQEKKAPAPQPAPVVEEAVEEEKPIPVVEEPVEETSAPAAEPEPAPQPTQEEPWVVRGELFHTYIMVEQGDKVVLIDKHAAHERVNFDRLKAQNYQPMVQELLTPITLTLGPQERQALLDGQEVLEGFGFQLEEFGSGSLAVRAVPDYLETGDVEPTLLELAKKLRLTGWADPGAARDEVMHTMACKAAIKGGQRNDPQELERVAGLVMGGAVKYCPHGRPVAIELTRGELEKQFKRA
ncbi:MAG TPA: DNA mismatch repair endonuclease MutL [Candidatus Enterenecus avicola]|nr:DNA mismatch repair endonuclease MutL [Candidatus Enterenecus avicola]